jgi:hypothetical protein
MGGCLLRQSAPFANNYVGPNIRQYFDLDLVSCKKSLLNLGQRCVSDHDAIFVDTCNATLAGWPTLLAKEGGDDPGYGKPLSLVP